MIYLWSFDVLEDAIVGLHLEKKKICSLKELLSGILELARDGKWAMTTLSNDFPNAKQVSNKINDSGKKACIASGFINIYPQADNFLSALCDVHIPSFTRLIVGFDGFIIPPLIVQKLAKVDVSLFENRFISNHGLSLRWAALLYKNNVPLTYHRPFKSLDQEALADLAKSFECFYKHHHEDLFDEMPWEPTRTEITVRNKEYIELIKNILKYRGEYLTDATNELQWAVEHKVGKQKLFHDIPPINAADLNPNNLQETHEPKFAFLATFPKRRKALKRVIKCALREFDHIYVYLNGYEKVPSFLNNPKITCKIGQGDEDMGARGKVYFAAMEKPQGYWFFLDDDNAFNVGYADYLVNKIEKYNRKCAVCSHGSILTNDKIWYFHKYSIYPYGRYMEHDRFVNLLGSGTLCLHSSMLKFELSDFNPYTMVDLAFSLLLKEQGMGIINVKRPQKLLRHLKSANDGGLFADYSRDITVHTLAIMQKETIDWAHVAKFLGAYSDMLDLSELDPDQLDAWHKGVIPKSWGKFGNVYVQTTGKMFDNFSAWILPLRLVDIVSLRLLPRAEYKTVKSLIRKLVRKSEARKAMENSFSVKAGQKISLIVHQKNPLGVAGLIYIFTKRVLQVFRSRLF